MREFHRDLMRFITGLGGESARIEKGSGKHPRLLFVWGGSEYSRVIPWSPSDRRALRNAMADVRRMLGLVDHEKHVGARRVKRARAPERVRPPQPADVVYRDFRDTLAEVAL